MNLSVLDIFKIGLGPSSSHTMGPMNAARRFVLDLEERGLLGSVRGIAAQLYGSLALTGLGHCTDRAVLLGLEGFAPDSMDPEAIEPTLARIRGQRRLRLLGRHEIAFDEPMDLLLHRDQTLPGHPNGLRFTALDASGAALHREEFFSTGGGFIVRAAELGQPPSDARAVKVPLPFATGDELLSSAASMASSCMSWCCATRAPGAVTPKRARRCCASGRRWISASSVVRARRACCRAC